jgi:predicted small metal-binding protein
VTHSDPERERTFFYGHAFKLTQHKCRCGHVEAWGLECECGWTTQRANTENTVMVSWFDHIRDVNHVTTPEETIL